MKTAKHLKIWVLGVLGLLFSTAFPLQAQQSFADLDYPYSVEYQQLGNGQRVAYIDEGDGSPLILIHGLGSYIPAWKQNIPKLSKFHRVIALDLPGFGKSTKKVSGFSISFFAETVAQLQDSLGIDAAAWIGHSMGGQIALKGALNYPGKISRLVLIAPAGLEKFTDQEGAMMKQFVTPASIKATPEPAIRQRFKLTFYDLPEEAQFMADDRVAIREAEDFDLYAHAYAGSVQAMLDEPVFSELSIIKQPTLIIFGKQDALIPNKQLHPDLTIQDIGEAGKNTMANSRLKMVDEAGHFVHFEKADLVNRYILNFFNH